MDLHLSSVHEHCELYCLAILNKTHTKTNTCYVLCCHDFSQCLSGSLKVLFIELNNV